MRVSTAIVVGLVQMVLAVGVGTEARAQGRSSRGNPRVSEGSSFGYNRDLQRVNASTRIRRAPSIRSVSRYSRGLSANALSVSQPNTRAKPFSNVQRRPTLSPYLNLLRNDGDSLGGLPNYYTFVRPALEQQRTNRRQQRDIRKLGQEVQSVNRQLMFQGDPSNAVRPTGHTTVFMNHSHYYTFGRR